MTVLVRIPLTTLMTLAMSVTTHVGAEESPAPPAVQMAAPAAVVVAPLPSGPVLTLPQAIALAGVRNETNAIAQARLEEVDALRKQAYSLLYPSLDADASYQTQSSSREPFARRPVETWQGDVALSMSIFNASAFPAVSAANKTVAAQELTSRELRRALSFAVAGSFIDVIAGEQQRQAALRRRAVAERTVADARARAEVGLASVNDATRARLELSQAELTLSNASQAVTTARLQLADLIGEISVDGPLQIPDSAIIPGRDPAALEPTAISRREDLMATALREIAERKQAQQARLGFVPSLAVRGTYYDRTLNAPNVPDGDPQWTVALTAHWSLWDGGNRLAVAQIHDAIARENAAVLRSAKRDLHRDLATGTSRLNTAEISVSQAEIGLTVAQTNASEVQARAAQGLATALEVADANASQFQAESDLARQRLNLESARFDLRRLVGFWPISDTEPAEYSAHR